jgi:hypothetical protein
MILSVISRPTSVVVEFSVIIKICKYRRLHEGHHFISMAMEVHGECHNLNLMLATKARAYKCAGQEWNMGFSFHVPKSVGKCEGMNPHIPKCKWARTLGVGVLIDSQIFKGKLQGSRLIWLRFPDIIGKFLECRCLKWVRMTHLGTWSISYGQKKGRESNC